MSETGGMDAFAQLGDELRGALSERGFTTPTEPQRRAIPALADGHNGLVVAPTGTGKTETAMLPVLDSLVSGDGAPEGFGALYVTPLRALNRDMRERLDWWGETLGLDVDVRHGDTTDYQRKQQADDPPDVLVTTPETLQAMLTGKKLRDGLADVEHVVVDEVHELAGAKRGAQLSIGLERLVELAGSFQRVGLSATVGDPHEVGAFLTGGRGCEIIEVDVTSKVDFEVREPEVTDSDERLANELMTSPEMASHVRAIREIVDRHDSVLIFVNTRQTAEALGSRFKELDANIGVHHGSLSKEARIDVEDRFKAGELDGLLCTSSMELGIDVGRIDHVVQYSSPREVKRLLQRVGRAGHRRDEVSEGTVVTGNPDDALEALAIARRASEGAVEETQIHHGSLDTVANQIVGVAMDFGETEAWHAYNVVTRAYPFKELPEETFREVAMELHRNRVVYVDEDEDTISKSGGTWQYYYANLSMIPDEETYEVYDMAAGRQVGTLDERFVVNFAEPGATFVQRGEMWRITNIDEDDQQVEVSPIEDPTGEVPSWTGQEIPVPYEVAQAVGEMRATAGSQFEAGGTDEAVAREFTARYPTDDRTARGALGQVSRQTEQAAPVPSDDRIVVEQAGTTVVVNACLGHEANETLGRLLSALLGQQTGSSVGLDVGPYRVELEVPARVSANDVVDVLRDTDPEHVEAILELSLKQSETLKFTLANVAAKFGALKRYRTTSGRPSASADDGWKGRDGVGLSRLLGALEDTPVYDEAVREVFHTDLDVERAGEVLERVQSGDLEVDIVGERTAVGAGGRSSGTELLTPENADASVVQTVKERIRDDRVKLFCVHCTDWTHETKVRRVTDQPECPRCGSTRVAALSPWADEVVTAVRSDDKDDEQDDQTERAYRNASIVQSHGKQAVIALSARGVGPRNAARVINRHREDEADFYRDILEREREYARTKAFW
ncbi:DEAD/DEAH box helicase [Halobacterium rubrum]|uniref:DEAD/DEAH box helicase n=1 Tax=Halobacterium TaxID=2239 RepID=UPI001F32752A|nr:MULTISPECIES: DEAD/DEAH box helicase [Halobacterium]MDH5020014.1 DEAD/DEAH box helicase [Halobacterium rubrum]